MPTKLNHVRNIADSLKTAADWLIGCFTASHFFADDSKLTADGEAVQLLTQLRQQGIVVSDRAMLRFVVDEHDDIADLFDVCRARHITRRVCTLVGTNDASTVLTERHVALHNGCLITRATAAPDVEELQTS